MLSVADIHSTVSFDYMESKGGIYDASYYETHLVRAVESVLSPLGWNRTDIR